jgi:Ca-activated chloride channel family protein
LLRESGAAVYAIHIAGLGSEAAWDLTHQTESQLLDDFAEPSGGRHYPITSRRELADAAEKAGRQMRDQYLLGYAPAKSAGDGKYHRVQVKVVPGPGQHRLTAFWRRGYYAP